MRNSFLLITKDSEGASCILVSPGTWSTLCYRELAVLSIFLTLILGPLMRLSFIFLTLKSGVWFSTSASAYKHERRSVDITMFILTGEWSLVLFQPYFLVWETNILSSVLSVLPLLCSFQTLYSLKLDCLWEWLWPAASFLSFGSTV